MMKKRVIFLLAVFVLAVSLLPTAVGAEGNAKEISTAEEFAAMEKSGNYILTKDITVDEPYANDFSGTFDGNGHTVTLNIEKNKANLGLFKTLAGGASIKNVIVTGNVNAESSNRIGGIAGFANVYSGKISIINCKNDATISGNKGVGGILGDCSGNKNKLTIEGCVNTGEVTGKNAQVGGIIGNLGSGHSVSYCYNRGNIAGVNFVGGIVGQSAVVINYSYSTGEITATQTSKGDIYGGSTGAEQNQCFKLESVSDTNISTLIKTGKFVTDENNINNGYPILLWQASGSVNPPAPAEPGISIRSTAGNSIWSGAGGDNKNQTTLSVVPENMGTETPNVTWSYPSNTDIATFNEDTDKGTLVVTAGKGGVAEITATVVFEEKEYTATTKITVIPDITYVDIVNPNGGAVAQGQTVEAEVLTTGGNPYDEEHYPALSYQWYWYDASSGKSEAISGATDKSYTIPENYAHSYIEVEVSCNGKVVRSHDDTYTPVSSSNYGKLCAVAYDKDFTLPTDIKEDTTLTLPADHTKDGIKANIEWSSNNAAIDAKTGAVTRPASGKTEVTLTASFTYRDAFVNHTFKITVWSDAAIREEEENDKQMKLKNDVDAALGDQFKLYPVYGTDTSVVSMMQSRLSGVDVAVKFVAKTNATNDSSNIADDGAITYFYTDPNTATVQRCGTYEVTFTLSRDGVSVEKTVPVIVYWDADKVERVMKAEILSKVVLPDAVEADFDLPKVVDDKKWTLISWQSSDESAISISDKNQQTADTLFNPYVGVVTRQPMDKTVTLTAAFTFVFENGEQPIVLNKVFYVTVKGDPNAADRAAQYQAALDKEMENHLTDAVSGERLTALNDVYTVYNDIQFPTTHDMKIDGKYTPVVITSSDVTVIEAPDVANAARVKVYRPLPGQSEKTVTLTISILDRPSGSGENYDSMTVLAKKAVAVTVKPLTQEEINSELALMEQAKAHYWDGIRNDNTDRENVTGDLHAFTEYTQNGVWIYTNADMTGSGIVPVPLDNWYDQQTWRLFRSSNADVVSHENLLITRQEESRAVTITSYLSSETLGRYAEMYPDNEDFQKLYKQPVSVTIVVTGTQYAQSSEEPVLSLRKAAATRAVQNRAVVTVSFSLSGSGMGFSESGLTYDDGSTVFDVFSNMLAKHGYTCKRRGSYIAAITSDTGRTLEEFDEGKNSGWMYRVNGKLAGQYMSSQGLNDGDSIEMYFTSDWTKESGAEKWKPTDPVVKTDTVKNADGSTTKTETKSDGTVVETVTRTDGGTVVAETKPDGSVETVESRADGTSVKTSAPAGGGEITVSVSVPRSIGSTRVDVPVSKPTVGMVAVIVHSDGTEEVVKTSIVTEDGIALRAEGTMQLKIVDRSKRFADTQTHWSKDAVEFASARELFNGVSANSFGPELPMTRGMVNTVLARLADEDTNGGETWYAKGTAWAKTSGISDGTNPGQEVTREQLATMLYRYAGSPTVSGKLGFDDEGIVSIWAYDAVKWCADNGIMNGVGGGQMAPKELAQRGQVAAMLMRFLQATV